MDERGHPYNWAPLAGTAVATAGGASGRRRSRSASGAAVEVRVDDAQVLAPNAIRRGSGTGAGVKVSYGTIQQMLIEAEGRAARLNAQASLDGVRGRSKMFSQGEPVLAGVDPSVRVVVECDARWRGVGGAASHGSGAAGLSVVVKDAARIAAGVSEVFPRAEQRDDCFHVLYEMNKVRRRLERRAYGAMEREGEALGLGKIRAHDQARRRKAKRALSRARRECAEAIERFDEFEAAMGTLHRMCRPELHRPDRGVD